MSFLNQYLDFKCVTQIGLISDSQSSEGALNRVAHYHCLCVAQSFCRSEDPASTRSTNTAYLQDVTDWQTLCGQRMRANAIIVRRRERSEEGLMVAEPRLWDGHSK